MAEQQPTRHHDGGISGVILAAGSSQRMGFPKQLLRLGEKTLLEHVLASVRAASVGEIILVLGCAAKEIQQKISTDGVALVLNHDYQQGMGTSLRAGLAAINSSATGALIILGDQPLVRASTLDNLIESHSKAGCQIVIPVYRGFRGNPVLLDRSVFPEVMDLRGDIGCRAIFGNHAERIHRLSVDDPGILLDADTVADLQKLETLRPPKSAYDLFEPRLSKHRIDGKMALFQREEGGYQPELIIVGHDAVALALVRIGRVLRFTTTIVDPFLTFQDLPEADRILHCLDFSLLPRSEDRYVVIASRGQFDEEAMEQAFATNARYIALMASRARREELLAALQRRGTLMGNLSLLKAPAGLEIGAEAPEEIALSIMAQIVAERRASIPRTRAEKSKNQSAADSGR